MPLPDLMALGFTITNCVKKPLFLYFFFYILTSSCISSRCWRKQNLFHLMTKSESMWFKISSSYSLFFLVYDRNYIMSKLWPIVKIRHRQILWRKCIGKVLFTISFYKWKISSCSAVLFTKACLKHLIFNSTCSASFHHSYIHC